MGNSSAWPNINLITFFPFMELWSLTAEYNFMLMWQIQKFLGSSTKKKGTKIFLPVQNYNFKHTKWFQEARTLIWQMRICIVTEGGENTFRIELPISPLVCEAPLSVFHGQKRSPLGHYRIRIGMKQWVTFNSNTLQIQQILQGRKSSLESTIYNRRFA